MTSFIPRRIVPFDLSLQVPLDMGDGALDVGFEFGIGCGPVLVWPAEQLKLSDGEIRLSFAEMKARMQLAMIDQFEKFTAPNELWTFEKLGADELTAYASRLKKIPRKRARFAYNDQADIKQAVQQLGWGWEAYVANIMNDFILAMQTPLPRLFTTPCFTEASS